MRKPPLILHRLLMGDMLRLLGVTTVALVAVIAFAGALKPLADGRLTLDQALTFMGFLIVPMTQFALPFAAGFAATLTYHRFASDNEAMAAGAAGLGHKALLTPALGLGVALSIVLGVMSFEVIPPLLREAQRVLVTDGTRVLASQLNRGESVRLNFGGSDAVDLYADRAFPAQVPEPGTPMHERGVSRVITLEGVLVVSARDGGEDVYASAERVFLLVYDRTDDTLVELLLENTVANVSGAGGEGSAGTTRLKPMRLPTEVSDDPKFLTWSQMREAEREPRVMNKTDRNARVLEARLGERDAVVALTDAFARAVPVELVVDTAITGARAETVTIHGAGLLYDPALPDAGDGDTADPERARRRALRERVDRWRLAPAPGAEYLRVVRTTPEGTTLTHLARRANLVLPIENPGRSENVSRFALELRDVITLDGAPSPPYVLEGSEPARAELDYADLLPSDFDEDAHNGEPVRTLIERARDEAYKDHPLTPRIRAVMRDLRDRVDEQRREIMSKRHERLAFSVSCLMMVLAGAAVAMTLRDSLPLPVYLWSFLPALGCIITISAGQRVVHREGPIGLVLLWGGVVALALLFLRVYAKLRRH
ncbi:MAG: hypothetical protein Tsb0013_15040 [Phycisphaerales bacterium]